MVPPRRPGRVPCRAVSFVSAAVLFALARTPVGAAPLYDGFDDDPGLPLNRLNGGSGFDEPWSASYPAAIEAGSLSDPTGTLRTSGNRVRDVAVLGERGCPASSARPEPSCG